MSAETIKFRSVTPQEIGSLALVTARAHAYRDGEPLPTGVEPSQVSDLGERVNRPNVWTHVAISPEGVAGFALGYPNTDEQTPAEAADTEYLSFIMVEPEH